MFENFEYLKVVLGYLGMMSVKTDSVTVGVAIFDGVFGLYFIGRFMFIIVFFQKNN